MKIVALSRCSTSEITKYEAAIRKLGGAIHIREKKVKEDVDEVRQRWGQVTHCVQSVNDEYTFQDLVCSILGKWVLSKGWLTASIKNNRWMEEHMYCTPQQPVRLPSNAKLFITRKFFAREERPDHWGVIMRLLFDLAGGNGCSDQEEATHLLISKQCDPGWYIGVPGTNKDAIALTLPEMVKWFRYGGDASDYGVCTNDMHHPVRMTATEREHLQTIKLNTIAKSRNPSPTCESFLDVHNRDTSELIDVNRKRSCRERAAKPSRSDMALRHASGKTPLQPVALELEAEQLETPPPSKRVKRKTPPTRTTAAKRAKPPRPPRKEGRKDPSVCLEKVQIFKKFDPVEIRTESGEWKCSVVVATHPTGDYSVAFGKEATVIRVVKSQIRPRVLPPPVVLTPNAARCKQLSSSPTPTIKSFYNNIHKYSLSPAARVPISVSPVPRFPSCVRSASAEEHYSGF